MGGRSLIIVPGMMDCKQEKRLLYLGVHGIVAMARFWTDLPLAVRALSEGRLWISRETLESYVKVFGPSPAVVKTEEFTAREHQILQLLLSGCSNKDIASALQISDRTVKFHVSNILRKSNVSSRKDLRNSHANESLMVQSAAS
jgi:DNA-binding NarL/FixJ family response regulator